jgi:hypothetical protein
MIFEVQGILQYPNTPILKLLGATSTEMTDLEYLFMSRPKLLKASKCIAFNLRYKEATPCPSAQKDFDKAHEDLNQALQDVEMASNIGDVNLFQRKVGDYLGELKEVF